MLPAVVELSAYRIVEQLLDALGTQPDVRVRFADDALELTVSGPVSRRGVQAIERARERVQLHAGTLAATTRGGRAEAVVSLPAAGHGVSPMRTDLAVGLAGACGAAAGVCCGAEHPAHWSRPWGWAPRSAARAASRVATWLFATALVFVAALRAPTSAATASSRTS